MLTTIDGLWDDIGGGIVKIATAPITIPLQLSGKAATVIAGAAGKAAGQVLGAVRSATGALRPPAPPQPDLSTIFGLGGDPGPAGGSSSAPSMLPILLGGGAAAALLLVAVLRRRRPAS